MTPALRRLYRHRRSEFKVALWVPVEIKLRSRVLKIDVNAGMYFGHEHVRTVMAV
jgi:hypothetical protein